MPTLSDGCDDLPEIKNDKEMKWCFEKMFGTIEKMNKKAVAHNKRLPEAILARIDEGCVAPALQQVGWSDLELYERTRTVGPLKRFADSGGS